MRTVAWIGAALLTAAGVAVLVENASATVVLPKHESQGTLLDSAQVTNAATAVGGCWTGPLAEIRGAEIYRGVDAEVGNLYVDLKGWQVVDRATAEAHVAAGGKLGPGRRIPQTVVKCQITGSTRLTALQNLASGLWSQALSTLTKISLTKTGSSVRVNYVVGQESISEAEAVDRSEAGQTIEPTGVVQ